MSPSGPRSFLFGQANTAADEASRGNAAADDTVAAVWLGRAVAHMACVHYDCCTGQHKVANKDTRRQCGVVIWLTSDATSICVGADQEHLSLMGEHCLGC